MVAVGGSITAANYNAIRIPSGLIQVNSYGQSLRSDQVTALPTSITDDQMFNLFLDLTSVYVHQNNSMPSLVPPATGQTVGADTSLAHDLATGSQSAVANSSQMGYNDYEAVSTSNQAFSFTVDADHLRFPDANFALAATATATRTTSWGVASTNNDINHVVDLVWSSSARRDNWLASGGRVYLNASLTGGTGAKSIDWAALLSAMGTIKIDFCDGSADSGTAYRGFNDITDVGSAGSLMFLKTGSGVYSDNFYRVYAKEISSTKIRLVIQFVDGDVGTGGQGIDPGGDDDPIDESVNGTLTSVVTTYDPDSEFIYNGVTYTAVDNTGVVNGTSITNIHSLTNADPQPAF